MNQNFKDHQYALYRWAWSDIVPFATPDLILFGCNLYQIGLVWYWYHKFEMDLALSFA
jgi:hypothetical protein